MNIEGEFLQQTKKFYSCVDVNGYRIQSKLYKNKREGRGNFIVATWHSEVFEMQWFIEIESSRDISYSFAGARGINIIGLDKMDITIAEMEPDDLALIPVTWIKKTIVSTIIENPNSEIVKLKNSTTHEGPYRHIFLD